jgi:hypothetical protein
MRVWQGRMAQALQSPLRLKQDLKFTLRDLVRWNLEYREHGSDFWGCALTAARQPLTIRFHVALTDMHANIFSYVCKIRLKERYQRTDQLVLPGQAPPLRYVYLFVLRFRRQSAHVLVVKP